MKKSLIMATALALTLCAGCKEKNVNDARVDELMSKMTLAEKIGQLNQFVPTNSVVTGPDGSPVDVNRVIKEGQCGSLLNVWKPEEIIELQRLAVDSSRLGITTSYMGQGQVSLKISEYHVPGTRKPLKRWQESPLPRHLHLV